jgi:ATP-dependent helicase HrpA
MLLAEVQGDPMLGAYDTIIVDEAHERSLNIDFLLGHLGQLRFRRPELKIIITSATIDTKMFSEAFDDAPVIDVSGRAFPVETIYMPLDTFGSDYVAEEDDPAGDAAEAVSAKAEAWHYVDGAVEAVGRVIEESRTGDVLVFMPSERDIRECCDLLKGRLGNQSARFELVPLFGRLSNEEQQRVFDHSQRRKIIVATNIAETSLTIPGIRYVVDTGLSRLSRYAPTARTRRLPIEPVAQSSADQRKGRAGRVAEGVCIRLYSEEDYLARPRFTQPEIQRANLADVILRLKAFGLGDIERFPFINPPATKAIRAGYALLEELGAIEQRPEARSQRPEAGSQMPEVGSRKSEVGSDLETVCASRTTVRPSDRPTEATSSPPISGLWELTDIGRELARLPVDPTVGRMILQARNEKCLREVLIIAAGLSIQDPRERPLEKQAAADAAHRRFAHPDSDFLTLLNIWESYHDEFETLSQGKMRRFCRDHFLSYVRMREWRDIHAQLLDVLRERSDFRMSSVRDGLIGDRKSEVGGQKVEARGQKPEAGGRKSEVGNQRLGSKERGLAAAKGSLQSSKSGGQRRAPDVAAERAMLFGSASYRTIHRSILSGLLGNIAFYDEESRLFKATQDRKVALFPGSVLARKEDRKKSFQKPQEGAKERGPQMPRWIMTSEIVETSRVYARTCAKLDPRWLMDLGGHLIKVSHSEPFWNPDAGRVMVKQRSRLYGLEIDMRSVGYGNVNPVHATDIFIREGLVGDTITWPFDFIAHNRRVREKIEFSLTRMRDSGYLNLDEALYRFYAARLMPDAAEPRRSEVGDQMSDVGDRKLEAVSSVPELIELVRHRRAVEPRFLLLEPEDLRDPESLAHDSESYPEALPIENHVIPLAYAYKPGQADDGVTLDVNVRDAADLTAAALDWAVPGHIQDKVEFYLRALPKELRRAFVPFAETVPAMTKAVESLSRLRGGKSTLAELLAEHLRERFGLNFNPGMWDGKTPPDHLRMRVRVCDDEGRELCASRDLAEVQSLLSEKQHELAVAVDRDDPELWRRARARWEKPESMEWSFGDIPVEVIIGEQAGVSVIAYPALVAGGGGVTLRLMRSAGDAEAATARGVARLLELQLGRDLMWLERDLKAMRQLGPQAAIIAPLDRLQEDAFKSLRLWLCDPERLAVTGQGSERIRKAVSFAAALAKAKNDLTGLIPRLVDMLREIVDLRQTLISFAQPYPGQHEEVIALVPSDFLLTTPYQQLKHIARYLKAKKIRAERWKQNPSKDAERARQVDSYSRRASQLGRGHKAYWLVEEFRVSVFAQELGTAESVSAVKLDRLLSEVRTADVAEPHPTALASAPAPVTPPPASAPAAPKKKAPLKSLSSLDQLLRK